MEPDASRQYPFYPVDVSNPTGGGSVLFPNTQSTSQAPNWVGNAPYQHTHPSWDGTGLPTPSIATDISVLASSSTPSQPQTHSIGSCNSQVSSLQNSILNSNLRPNANPNLQFSQNLRAQQTSRQGSNNASNGTRFVYVPPLWSIEDVMRNNRFRLRDDRPNQVRDAYYCVPRRQFNGLSRLGYLELWHHRINPTLARLRREVSQLREEAGQHITSATAQAESETKLRVISEELRAKNVALEDKVRHLERQTKSLRTNLKEMQDSPGRTELNTLMKRMIGFLEANNTLKIGTGLSRYPWQCREFMDLLPKVFDSHGVPRKTPLMPQIGRRESPVGRVETAASLKRSRSESSAVDNHELLSKHHCVPVPQPPKPPTPTPEPQFKKPKVHASTVNVSFKKRRVLAEQTNPPQIRLDRLHVESSEVLKDDLAAVQAALNADDVRGAEVENEIPKYEVAEFEPDEEQSEID